MPEGGIRRVSVVLDEDPERTVVIPITKTNQGGARSGDYSADPDPTNVTFNAGGDLTQTFTFTAVEDTLDDDGESVLLGFGAITDTRVTVGTPSQSTVSITDDDDPEVTVQFKETSYTATEGGTVATVTVEISVDPERSLEIPIRAAGANGATGLDFGRSAVFVTFTAGGGPDADLHRHRHQRHGGRRRRNGGADLRGDAGYTGDPRSRWQHDGHGGPGRRRRPGGNR